MVFYEVVLVGFGSRDHKEVLVGFTNEQVLVSSASSYHEHNGVDISHIVHNQVFDSVKIYCQCADGQKLEMLVISPSKKSPR